MHSRGNLMAKTADYERSLEKWMSGMIDLHPGLTIKTLDGESVVIHTPYTFGSDFVAGCRIADKPGSQVAVPYAAIASVHPLNRRV
jgi:hypothetical protein